MTRVPFARLLCFAFALALLASCSPKIASFTALPKSICDDDAFTMRWETRGDPNMTVSLHRAAEGSQGTPDTLAMVLTAGTKQDPPTRTEDVLVYPSSFTSQLFFEATTDGNEVHAVDEANPGKWPKNFVVDSVASASGIAIVVHHAGSEASVDAAGTPSSSLAGLPILGRWELQAEVPSGEEPPEILVLDITANCGS